MALSLQILKLFGKKRQLIVRWSIYSQFDRCRSILKNLCVDSVEIQILIIQPIHSTQDSIE